MKKDELSENVFKCVVLKNKIKNGSNITSPQEMSVAGLKTRLNTMSVCNGDECFVDFEEKEQKTDPLKALEARLNKETDALVERLKNLREIKETYSWNIENIMEAIKEQIIKEVRKKYSLVKPSFPYAYVVRKCLIERATKLTFWRRIKIKSLGKYGCKVFEKYLVKEIRIWYKTMRAQVLGKSLTISDFKDKATINLYEGNEEKWKKYSLTYQDIEEKWGHYLKFYHEGKRKVLHALERKNITSEEKKYVLEMYEKTSLGYISFLSTEEIEFWIIQTLEECNSQYQEPLKPPTFFSENSLNAVSGVFISRRKKIKEIWEDGNYSSRERQTDAGLTDDQIKTREYIANWLHNNHGGEWLYNGSSQELSRIQKHPDGRITYTDTISVFNPKAQKEWKEKIEIYTKGNNIS